MLRSQSDARIKLNVQDTLTCRCWSWLDVGSPNSFTLNFKDRKIHSPFLRSLRVFLGKTHGFPQVSKLSSFNRLVGKTGVCGSPTLSDENLRKLLQLNPSNKNMKHQKMYLKNPRTEGEKTKSSLNPSDLRICVFLLGFFLGLSNIFVSELPGYWLVNLPPP